MKVRKGIARIFNGVVAMSAAAIIIGMLCLSFFVTCRMSVLREHIFFLTSSIAALLAGLVVILIIALAIRHRKIRVLLKRVDNDHQLFKRLLRNLTLVYFILAATFVIVMRAAPTGSYDQYYVARAATKLSIDARDDWIPASETNNAYLSRWPNQVGLVLLEFLGGTIVGTQNYFAFAIVNCVMLALMMLEFDKIMQAWGWKNRYRLLGVLGLMMFLPFIPYCTYAYGNIAGLFFAVRAMRYAVTMRRKNALKNSICCAVSSALSIVIKQNYIIFAMATAIYLCVKALRRKRVALVVCAVVALVASVFALKVPQMTVMKRVKADETLAAPTIEWVNMGISDNGEIAPGWWNSNIKTLEETQHLDGEKMYAESLKELKSRAKYLWHHKKEALVFFARKMASCWLDPTFEGNMIIRRVVPAGDISRPSWALNWIGRSGEEQQSYYMRPFVALVWFGSAFFLIDKKNRKAMLDKTPLLMAFVGGFIFHIFWEAKSQYTFEYFVLLIPFATKGCSDFCRLVLRSRRKQFKKCSALCAVAYVALVIVALLWLKPQKIATDMAEYADYVAHTNYSDMSVNGRYAICAEENLCLSFTKDGIVEMSNKPAKLRIKTYKDVAFLSNSEHYYLKRDGSKIKRARLDVNDANWKWRIVRYNDGYVILEASGKYYLKYDVDKKQFSYEAFEYEDEPYLWQIGKD